MRSFSCATGTPATTAGSWSPNCGTASSFEVRRVNGPGSRGRDPDQGPGCQRRSPLFPAPHAASSRSMVGDSLTYDAAGLPVLNRFLGSSAQSFRSPATAWRRSRRRSPSRQPQTPTTFSNIGLPPDLACAAQRPAGSTGPAGHGDAIVTNGLRAYPPVRMLNWIPRSTRSAHSTSVNAMESFSSTEQIPIGQLMLQYQEAALVAEQQLEADVRVLEAYNVEVQAIEPVRPASPRRRHGPRPRRGSGGLGEMDGRPAGIRRRP